MEAVLLCSKVIPRAIRLKLNRKFSFRHLNEHLNCNSLPTDSRNTSLLRNFEAIKTHSNLLYSPFPVRKGSCVLSRCLIYISTLKMNPLDSVKLTLLLSIWTLAAIKVVTLVWMYFSWTWLFWPWFIALSLTGYIIYCFRKHWLHQAKAFEQLSIVTSLFTWLTLAPPACFNGYLEGWPSCTHDPKRDVDRPLWSKVLFGVGVMVGHWLAAFEGPGLHRLQCLYITFLTLHLVRYSEKVVVPTAVASYIYASTVLLFPTYCTALRAPLSLSFLVAVCLVYYDKKAKLEEELMVESFGKSYTDYVDKVRHKFIPFVY
ncbi:hypothetical protein N665_0809s0016 [Sinapis alba]|nr:hypothetical protein N665_0809s0016 [Sinapis alba]